MTRPTSSVLDRSRRNCGDNVKMLSRCSMRALTYPTPGIISKTIAVAVTMKPISPDYGAPAVSGSHICATPNWTYFVVDVQIFPKRVSACRLGAIVRHQQGCAMGTLTRHIVSWLDGKIFRKTLQRRESQLHGETRLRESD